MLPYLPDQLPPADLERRLAALVGLSARARGRIERYDGRLERLVNPHVLLSPLQLKEAEQSSRIEGTQASADEVYQQEAGEEFGEEKSADIREIINYRQVLIRAKELVDEQGITNHLIRTMHYVLMQGVRGHDKHPGQFRSRQVHIGPRFGGIEDATYVPPQWEHVQGCMDALQEFMNVQSDNLDPVVQAGLIHAQFEMIHPFDDGNGRIGRILIPLFLYARGILSNPSFYLSGYFEEHRDAYVEALDRISKQGDWQSWLRFFLQGVEQQANVNLQLISQVEDLYARTQDRVREVTKSHHFANIVDFLFRRPVFNAPELGASGVPVTPVQAGNYVRTLRQEGVITEVRPGRGRRPGRYRFDSLIEIIR